MDVKRALYIGRFQPLHLGHYSVVEKIAEEVDEVIIGIGSAQESHTLVNPFTAGERVLMIAQAMKTIKKPAYVIPIEDVSRNSIWVSHVRSMIPPCKIVYANNALVCQLFSEAGYDVRNVPMFNREEYSGTEIRKRMLSGEDWRCLVPAEVARVVDSYPVRGTERICNITQKDY